MNRHKRDPVHGFVGLTSSVKSPPMSTSDAITMSASISPLAPELPASSAMPPEAKEIVYIFKPRDADPGEAEEARELLEKHGYKVIVVELAGSEDVMLIAPFSIYRGGRLRALLRRMKAVLRHKGEL